jgi:hypothetical protein
MHNNNAELIVLTVFVLTAAFFAFLYWVEKSATTDLRRKLAGAEHVTKVYKHLSLEVTRDKFPENPKMRIVTDDALQRLLCDEAADDFRDNAARITYLENENATLRTDVETGCRLIDEQRNMITIQKNVVNNLRRQMAQDRRDIMQQKKRK